MTPSADPYAPWFPWAATEGFIRGHRSFKLRGHLDYFCYIFSCWSCLQFSFLVLWVSVLMTFIYSRPFVLGKSLFSRTAGWRPGTFVVTPAWRRNYPSLDSKGCWPGVPRWVGGRWYGPSWTPIGWYILLILIQLAHLILKVLNASVWTDVNMFFYKCLWFSRFNTKHAKMFLDRADFWSFGFLHFSGRGMTPLMSQWHANCYYYCSTNRS